MGLNYYIIAAVTIILDSSSSMPNAAGTRDLHTDLFQLPRPFVAFQTNAHDPTVTKCALGFQAE